MSLEQREECKTEEHEQAKDSEGDNNAENEQMDNDADREIKKQVGGEEDVVGNENLEDLKSARPEHAASEEARSAPCQQKPARPYSWCRLTFHLVILFGIVFPCFMILLDVLLNCLREMWIPRPLLWIYGLYSPVPIQSWLASKYPEALARCIHRRVDDDGKSLSTVFASFLFLALLESIDKYIETHVEPSWVDSLSVPIAVMLVYIPVLISALSVALLSFGIAVLLFLILSRKLHVTKCKIAHIQKNDTLSRGEKCILLLFVMI